MMGFLVLQSIGYFQRDLISRVHEKGRGFKEDSERIQRGFREEEEEEGESKHDDGICGFQARDCERKAIRQSFEFHP